MTLVWTYPVALAKRRNPSVAFTAVGHAHHPTPSYLRKLKQSKNHPVR